jgi:NAD+ kinase
MPSIATVGLVLHPRRNCSPATATLAAWAAARNVSVLGLAGEIERAGPSAVPVDERSLAERCDLVISLGGDGTMLRALRLVHGTAVPVLGVNLGRLGFLAEIDIPDLADALTAIHEQRFQVETRSGVHASFGDRTAFGLNDVVLVRVPGRGGSAVVELRVDGERFLRYAADAIVVATPTGSTAYAFSAGGPIISPNAEGLLVIPSAPHSAFNRALFLPCDERVGLAVLPSSGLLAVEVDGRVVGEVGPGDVVEVRMVRAAASVVRLGGTTFYRRAQRRLGLTGSAEADRD